MKRLFFVLALFASLVLAMPSCKVYKQTTQTTTTITYDTLHKHVVLYDTTIVQKADTLNSRGLSVDSALTSHQVDSLNAALDSAKYEALLKDKRIKALMLQIANKQFSLPPITTTSEFAKATAGVTNNKLWLQLVLDSLYVINTTTTDSTTITKNVVTDTTITNDEEESVWRNPWFYAAGVLALLCIGFLVALVLVIIKR